MNLRQAAEQALEALMQTTLEDAMVEVEPNVWEYKSIVAIQALRQALREPKREWVGLSDEEKQWFKDLGLAGVEFIEAKLREKNS